MGKLKKIFYSFSLKERKLFWAGFLVATLSLVALGFIYADKITKALPARGGNYTEGMVGQPTFINPILAVSEIDKSLVRLIFSRLEDLTPKMEIGEGGRVLKARLEGEVFWSDGEKLTSDDIIFTVQKIKDEEARSPLYEDWRGISVKRISELEVEFELAGGPGFFGDRVKDLYILPRHIFEDVPPSNWRISDFNLKPVGSGPFRFLDFSKKSNGFITEYKLEINPDYFKEKPLIEKINFAFFPTTEDLISGFNSGAVDGAGGLTINEITGIRRPYEKLSFKLPNYYAIFMNQSRNPLLKEIGFRKVLAATAPRETIVQVALGNLGSPEWGPIPLETETGDSSIKEGYIFTTSAGEVLDNLGWKFDETQTSLRKKMIGKTETALELTLTVPDIDFLKTAGEELKKEWEKLGMKLNIISVSQEEIKEVIKNRDYELVLYGNVLNERLDLNSFWHSSQRFHPGLNLSMYSSKEADKLIEKISEVVDVSKSKEDFKALQKLITEDFPAVFLFLLWSFLIINPTSKPSPFSSTTSESN